MQRLFKQLLYLVLQNKRMVYKYLNSNLEPRSSLSEELTGYLYHSLLSVASKE